MGVKIERNIVPKNIVLGVSGASGSILALRTLQGLVQLGCRVHLIITQAALYTASFELGKAYRKVQTWLEPLQEDQRELVQIYHHSDFGACIASGSFDVHATLIVPCSMASLAAISMGLGDNLLRRVADVAIKEKRRLVLCPRELPLSAIHLEHMAKLSKLDVVIAPPTPAWYIKHQNIREMEMSIAARLIQLCNLPKVEFFKGWEGEHQERDDLALF